MEKKKANYRKGGNHLLKSWANEFSFVLLSQIQLLTHTSIGGSSEGKCWSTFDSGF